MTDTIRYTVTEILDALICLEMQIDMAATDEERHSLEEEWDAIYAVLSPEEDDAIPF